MEENIDELKKFLKTKGLRFTKQREVIVNEFLKTGSHISAGELYRKVSAKYKNIGFATVYRTLKVLIEFGLAEGKSFGDGQARFEPSKQTSHHDHLICEKCGKILEFYDSNLEKIQEEISKKFGFTIKRHDLQIYGLCKKCNKS
ncbi:MAG: transcriptional repressor [Proteobacteria bacterium]|nr:transcriptional repressor [Pseudomonadota bacterium]